METCQKALSCKKLSKKCLEKILINFNKKLEMCNERQKALDQRQDELDRKSKEYHIQNQKLICEVTSRGYNFFFKISNFKFI